MPTKKQVKQIAIQLFSSERDNDGDFIAVQSEPTLYDVWNFDGRWRTDWLGGNANTRSLSGFDRVGVGGYRLDARITFRNMTGKQATSLRLLLNGIFEEPAFPRIIKISPDGDISKGVYCNIRSGAYGIRRELTVGRQAVNAQFSGVFRLNEIPSSYIIGGVLGSDVLYDGDQLTYNGEKLTFSAEL